MKPWYTSRTLWLNVLMALGAAAEMNLSMVRGMLEPHHYLLILMGVNAINVGLRFITSQPIQGGSQ